jgi:hypothetical protein
MLEELGTKELKLPGCEKPAEEEDEGMSSEDGSSEDEDGDCKMQLV